MLETSTDCTLTNMNIYQHFYDRTETAGTFLLSPDRSVICTYQQANLHSARLARHLRSLGVAPGDRVIAQLEKTPECLYLYFACLSVGAIYVPLNVAYQDDELRFFVGDAAPTLVVCDSARELFFESLGAHMVTTLCALLDETTADQTAGPVVSIESREDSDTAVILYTSGTTGRPKGAMITHGNLIANGLTLSEAWQWRPDDVMLHALPIFHIHGLFVATHLPVLNGSPIIFLPAFNLELISELLPHATVYMGVPTHYTRLISSRRLSKDRCVNMRLFTSGSAPLLESTFNEFADLTGHRIVERYGMTETGMNTSNPLIGQRKPGTVGPTLPGVQARIVNDKGESVEPLTPGALEVKGDNVFAGYWLLPDKTQEEFTVDGFFKTGDVAQIDEDGYVAIVGRDKDMIISGGLNIYPKEIETFIDKIPGVLECAVIGLPHSDFGEGVCAVVVRSGDVDITESDIIHHVKSQMANFKVPKWVKFKSELPRNTMGKVQKNMLRETYQTN
ncbi:MAG: malonyl-CoA/methylmalonyl-CoA synthetase [Candidatus Azotimanducaceae bacterium]|jgi:malonyl-CoA/methylmalonyl-CoA synthetase